MVNGWSARFSFDDILGSSDAVQEAIRLARRAAAASYPTLVVGESGTGKELFAQAVPSLGARATQRLDCA